MVKSLFEVKHQQFESKALAWAQQFEQVCFLHSNQHQDSYSTIDSLLAVDASAVFESETTTDTFTRLENFRTKHHDKWMLGFFGYDLKNELEDLYTSFPNNLGFRDCFFFIPKVIIKICKHQVEIEADDPELVFAQIEKAVIPDFQQTNHLLLKKRFSKEEYFQAFNKLKEHIFRGDIYEVNLCQEFYAEHANINPLVTFKKLSQISPTPFSTFFKINDKYILSASPERFLAKRGYKLISQPIKGTAPRGATAAEDLKIKETLRNNPKEIAENVMIVDLVRNDMTRSAMPGTVAAERKLEVHSFKQVHQLISTITCTKNKYISDIEAIKHVFPPGSMTGAPKISAMRLCDRYENSRRGVYSGTVGYFAPNGDFDFNVIIRTILYNNSSKYLSFHTGGAITVDAEPEKEYSECLLKASAILDALGTKLS